MKIAWSFAVVIFLFLANVASAAEHQTYDKDGISFSHPADWNVTSDEEQASRLIFVEGPDDALIVIDVYDADGALGLLDYAKIYSGAIKDENSFYFKRDDGEFSDVEKIGGHDAVVETFTAKVLFVFNMSFSTTFRRLQLSDKVLFVYLMVEDQAKKAALPGLEQVLSTVKLAKTDP